MRAARFIALTLLVQLLATSAASAGDSDSTRTGRFFWRGRPLPGCRSFLITEFGAHYLLNRDAQPWGDRSVFLTADLGYMKNLSEHEALGGLVHFGGGGDWTGFGPGVRYRRWLSQDVAADFTAGLDVVGSVDPGGEFGAPAPWVEVGVSAADVVSVTLRGEHWTGTIEPSRPDGSYGPKGVTTWHLGAKGGSYLGAVGTLGLVVLIAVVVATLSGTLD